MRNKRKFNLGKEKIISAILPKKDFMFLLIKNISKCMNNRHEALAQKGEMC